MTCLVTQPVSTNHRYHTGCLMASQVCFSHLHMKSISAHTRMLSLCKHVGKQKNSVCPKQAYVTHTLCYVYPVSTGHLHEK